MKKNKPLLTFLLSAAGVSAATAILGNVIRSDARAAAMPAPAPGPAVASILSPQTETALLPPAVSEPCNGGAEYGERDKPSDKNTKGQQDKDKKNKKDKSEKKDKKDKKTENKLENQARLATDWTLPPLTTRKS